MNLPHNWYKRWDNQLGTLQWWTEYAIYKTTNKCNHKHAGRGWITANRGCHDAWACEYEYVTGNGIEGW